jgi:hypothetical protein
MGCPGPQMIVALLQTPAAYVRAARGHKVGWRTCSKLRKSTFPNFSLFKIIIINIINNEFEKL